MKQYLGYSFEWLSAHNAQYTAQEISQQPQIWRNVWHMLEQCKQKWQPFLQPLLDDPETEIILTGAGSSAFAGATLAPWLREHTHRNVRAYGSTEIVANPLQYYSTNNCSANNGSTNKKTLLISYARSGNSPESVAAVQLADQLIPNCYHLFLTCNPNSSLSNYAANSPHICELVMPEGTHDLSFAMTSSITSMMLATILLLGDKQLQETQSIVEFVASLSQQKMNEWQGITKQLAKQSFQRIVYVGSSCFTGLSKEAALKVLELTAGKISTRFDSMLGLRHGPKFMIDKQTLVICLFSNDPYCRQYDNDLFNELVHDQIASQVIALSGLITQNSNILTLDTDLNDIWLIFPYLVFAQMLAFEHSLALNLTPDDPCPTGEVNRVVKGVNIYPFTQVNQQNK